MSYPKTRLGLNSSHCLVCMTRLEHKRGNHACCSDECLSKLAFKIDIDINSEIPESLRTAKASWMEDLEERKAAKRKAAIKRSYRRK